MPVRLRVESVGKSFGVRAVIKGLSFELGSPGALGITGPNGSGKTTLLKLLSGLYLPDRGRISIESEGRQYRREEYPDLIKMVSPELSLYGMLTGLENLRFFASVSGTDCPRNRQEELLELVGLQGRGDDRVNTYSSGMKQRLKYAVALLGEPEILMLDEPTANLDERGKEIVRRIVARQKEQGTLIIATNEPDDLREVDEIVELGG